jgi:hypothetical protein
MDVFRRVDLMIVCIIKSNRRPKIWNLPSGGPAIEAHKLKLSSWCDREMQSFVEKTKALAGTVDIKNPFHVYRQEVRRLTELVAHLIPGIEKRGFKNHHIDHIKPIWHGFNNNIPPEEIADISNLRMLPYRENMLKGRYHKPT